MKPTDIARWRLHHQLIAGDAPATPEGIVTALIAVQAQDFQMSKWAIGVRNPTLTLHAVDEAINAGKIVRTHLLRPTWHLVAAEDLRWLAALNAPRLLRAEQPRAKEMSITDAGVKKAGRVLEKALSGGRYLSREEIMPLFAKAGIATDGNRMTHLLYRAEVDGIICGGPVKNNKQTYVLLDEWIPAGKAPPREEALAALASRYFATRGPATLADFTWWSGLGGKEASQGLEAVKSTFHGEKIGDNTYYLKPISGPPPAPREAFLLPAFDEYLISYKDRSASLAEQHRRRTLSSNGIFYPTLVVNGQVAGLWKRTVAGDKLQVTCEHFGAPALSVQRRLDRAAGMLGKFLGKKPTIQHVVSK